MNLYFSKPHNIYLYVFTMLMDLLKILNKTIFFTCAILNYDARPKTKEKSVTTN